MARTKATGRRTGRPTFYSSTRPKNRKQKHTEEKAKERTFQNKKSFCHKQNKSKLKKWPCRKKNEHEAKVYLLYRKM